MKRASQKQPDHSRNRTCASSLPQETPRLVACPIRVDRAPPMRAPFPLLTAPAAALLAHVETSYAVRDVGGTLFQAPRAAPRSAARPLVTARAVNRTLAGRLVEYATA